MFFRTSLGVRTYLKSLFNVFGCIFPDFQPKRLHMDPFQVQNYKSRSLLPFPQGLFFLEKEGLALKKHDLVTKTSLGDFSRSRRGVFSQNTWPCQRILGSRTNNHIFVTQTRDFHKIQALEPWGIPAGAFFFWKKQGQITKSERITNKFKI